MLWRCMFTGWLCFAGVTLWAAAQEDLDAAIPVLKEVARPLQTAADLDALLAHVTDQQLVLLGESTHGTSEFYTWRAEISKRLVQDHAFNFLAVEGDWAAIYRLNRYVKQLPGAEPDARGIMRTFSRWPEWMWANEETLELIEWLRRYNQDRSPEDRVGVYGMDVYGDELALHAMLEKLERLDEDLAQEVRALYRVWLPYAGNMRTYTHALRSGLVPFAAGAQAGYDLLQARAYTLLEGQPAARFNLLQSALVIRHAEAHYRAMLDPALCSWNMRADHFYLTVERLLKHYGDNSRGIVWAHNTHIGDARATTMHQAGRRNIGMSSRLALGQDRVFAVGFGTYRGSVIAGQQWGAPLRQMPLPPGWHGSVEWLMEAVGQPMAMFIFDPKLTDLSELNRVRGHRAVGVTYDPAREVPGNYVPTRLAQRYNAFVFIRDTTALQPITHLP